MKNSVPSYSPFVMKIRSQIIKESEKSELIEPGFISSHLFYVEKYANELCDRYPEADRDVVGLGVWLHDIGRLQGIGDNHDVYGADIAKKILLDENYSTEKTDLVHEVCRSHSCKDIMPKSLEAKILASADAMSHFTPGFFLRLFNYFCKKSDYETARNRIGAKIEKDFNTKIFFEEGRNMVRHNYNALLSVFSE